MAEQKKSFVLYTDLISTFEELEDVEAGKLIKHLLRYVNDLNPEAPDRLTKLVFEPIKLQLKRDLQRWEGIKDKRSEAGKASAEARRLLKEQEQNSTKPTSVENVKENSTNPTVSDNGNVTVNGTVTVSVIKKDINVRKMEFSDTLIPFKPIYGEDLIKSFEGYWLEPNKSNSKFRMELEKTWDLARRLSTWAKNDKNFNKNSNQTTKFDRLIEANQQAPNPYLK